MVFIAPVISSAYSFAFPLLTVVARSIEQWYCIRIIDFISHIYMVGESSLEDVFNVLTRHSFIFLCYRTGLIALVRSCDFDHDGASYCFLCPLMI